MTLFDSNSLAFYQTKSFFQGGGESIIMLVFLLFSDPPSLLWKKAKVMINSLIQKYQLSLAIHLIVLLPVVCLFYKNMTCSRL